MTKVIYDKYENGQHVKHEVTEISEHPAQESAYQVGEIVNPYGSNIKIKQPAQEPSWQGLSDVELSLLAEKYTGADGLDVVDYGRAVMQAYGEKNHGS